MNTRNLEALLLAEPDRRFDFEQVAEQGSA
jgi:hypothetical protein